MGTPFKPAESTDRLYQASQPDGARAVEPLPSAANPSPSNPGFRRAFPRIPCRVLVDYVVDGKAYRDCIANISEGGAFIETSHPLRTGRPITLSFSLFQDQQPLRVVGEVVWSDATGAGVRLQPNAAIGQFCTRQSEVPEAPIEDFEEPVQSPVSSPAPSPAPPAPPIQAAAHPPDRRRSGSISAAIVPSIALIIVAMMGVLARYDSRGEIAVLGDKVDRLSQDWARVEAVLARHLADSARTVPTPTTAQPAEPTPSTAPTRPSTVVTPAPPTTPVAAAPPTAAVTRPAADQPTGQETVYVVQPGDTLFRIGMKFNLSTKALVELNQLTDADAIYVGQRLRIPATIDR